MTCARDTDRKAVVRLLRLLERSQGAASLSETGGVMHLETGAGGAFAVARETLDACRSAGLVDIAGGKATLREEGRLHLKRALHPEAGYEEQHRDTVVRPVHLHEQAQLVVNAAESPLGRLFSRKDSAGRAWISAEEFEAGERLRRDFERARLQPRISANWEASVAGRGRGSGGAAELSDFALDAGRRVEAAIQSLDPSLAGVALDVCCFLKGLELVERERQWPPRSAKLMLRTALSILARHYGLIAPRAAAPIRRWGTQDYRPAAFTPEAPSGPPA